MLSRALATTIASLEDVDVDVEGWQRLQSIYDHYREHPESPSLRFPDKECSDSGISLTLEYDPDNFDCPNSYDLGELKVALKAPPEIVEIGAAKWPQPRGPKPNLDLPPWLRDIASVWENGVGRSSTREFHKSGEPISQGAILSLYAYRVLDPDIRPSDIDREMKETIRIRNGGDPFA